MIKKMVIALVAMLVIGCKNENKSTEAATSKEIAKFHSEVEENAVIYEVNIRQYSPEGTFNAFTKDIPQLKELGVKIIWVMNNMDSIISENKTIFIIYLWILFYLILKM